MAKTISATDVVRRFSDILNSIKYRGNHFIILRGGNCSRYQPCREADEGEDAWRVEGTVEKTSATRQ